ncbi:cytidylyltransferase domain-containing protein [Sporocytophaga myxococcoides]|nr:glycosyltransferase family protein [Sporocytophaga myxococcoides]
MKKVGIVTQARMTSTRLPGKILKEINGKSLLLYHLERLATTGLPVIIATTENVTDDPVVEFSKKNCIPYHRGSENNVLSRYYNAAVENSLDVIVRVTSDCPLIDGQLIRAGINRYLEEGNESTYLSNVLKRYFPRGFDFEIFSFSLLKDAFMNAQTTSDLEHVTPYINQNKSGKVNFLDVVDSEDNSDIRITVDTPEDFLLLDKLIKNYSADVLSGKEITKLFRKFPELMQINAHIEQKKL